MTEEITKISSSLLIIISLLTACNSDLLYIDSVTMPDQTFTSDVYFTIRTGSDYPFRNIYLFVTTKAPDGKSMTDTLEYYLADEKGNWFGRGSGEVHELNLPYRSNIYFPRKGNYDFSIRHGMRTVDLKGVYDFGIRIQKFNR